MTTESTPTSDTSSLELGESDAPKDDVQYRFITVKAIRSRESAAIAKWQNQGWEFVGQTQGALRSELKFRKPRPKTLASYLVQGFAAFRRLERKRQKMVLGGAGAVAVLLLVVGGVAAAVGGDQDAPAASEPADVKSEVPSEAADASAEPTTAAERPTPERYSYQGPDYDVIMVDENQGPAQLSQYWIHTSAKFDFAENGYKDRVRLIIADIAHEQGTGNFIAQVVTNRQIAEAESPSTYKDFIAEHGEAYAVQEIPTLEEHGWVASYTGGFDPDAGEPSDSAAAYEIIWRPYGTSEVEKWKP